MNANQIAFGIEFETTLPASDTTPIGGYHRGIQVPWLPEGWKSERDSSIRPQASGRKVCEFVSPKLRGYEGLKQVFDAIDAITARGARANHTCGLHITIEWNGDAAALHAEKPAEFRPESCQQRLMFFAPHGSCVTVATTIHKPPNKELGHERDSPNRQPHAACHQK